VPIPAAPLSTCGQWRRRKMQFICAKAHIA
jgi:hypothetical protein